MFQIVFYVPREHCEAVKQAMFDAGAGRVGEYDSCAWQTAGTGQFRPLPGSDPFVGRTGELERLEEIKVEMVCEPEALTPALEALKLAHPYEEPAFAYYRINPPPR